MKRKGKSKSAPAELLAGQVAGALVRDINGIIVEARRYRTAYEDVSRALVKLAKLKRYERLEMDLKEVMAPEE